MDEYVPRNPNEQAIMDGLWSFANPSGSFELSGAQAVEFFRKSGVDVGILKQVWSLSTPLSTMTIRQFYTALRYISMVQNGEIPISKGICFFFFLYYYFCFCSLILLLFFFLLIVERLAQSITIDFGPPKFTGVQIPSLGKYHKDNI